MLDEILSRNLAMMDPEDIPWSDLNRPPSPWNIGPAVMQSAAMQSPAHFKSKAGLHRAAGFTRRFQRAAGLLADERHEKWDMNRLPENLLIESIRRDVAPCHEAQPAIGRSADAPEVLDEHVQHRTSMESREQKRTTAAAMAMAAGCRDHQRRFNESLARLHLRTAGATPELPLLQPTRVRLRTLERATQRAQQFAETFSEGPDAVKVEPLRDKTGSFVRNSARKSPSLPKTANHLSHHSCLLDRASVAMSAMPRLESVFHPSCSLFPGHPCADEERQRQLFSHEQLASTRSLNKDCAFIKVF